MQLYIKAQGATSGPTVVFDEHHQPSYIVSGRYGLTGEGFTVYTISGDALAEIKQISLGVLPRFDLFLHQKKVGRINRLFGFWHEFILVSDLNWLITGDLLNYHYKITHRTETIMELDQSSIALGEIYTLSITNEQDAPLCICLAMILDHWAKNRKKFQFGIRLTNPGLN